MSAVAFLLSLCLLGDPSVSETTASDPQIDQTASGESSKESPDQTPAPPTLSENVVVTATRSDREVSRLPVSVTVVGEKAIKASPVKSVDDLLREVPGVTPSPVSSSGSTPNNQRFSMHGLGGVRALVLVDGVPLHDPYSGLVQWQNVPLQSLRQIEVVRGGNASLFGNYALGGTINLITKPISQNDVSLDLSGGSWNTGRGSLVVDAVVNPTVALRLSHYQTDSDGYYRVPDPGPVDIEAWVNNAVTTARADLRFSDRSNGFINASTIRHDVSQGRPLAFIKDDIDAISGGYNYAVGAAGLISARLYTQDKTERLVNSRVVGAGASEYKTQDGTIDSTGSGASFVWSTQRSGAVPFLSVGVDLQRLEATEDRTSFDPTGAITEVAQVNGRQTFAGFFAQASWQPTDRLEILGSARYDWYRNDNGTELISGGTDTQYPASSSRQFDPRVSVRYAIGTRSALRAAVYRAFNAPTLRDLYRTTESGRSLLLGNPDLEAETLTGGEIGWEWATGNLRFDVHFYRSEIEGLLARVALEGQSNVYTSMNLGTSRSQGVELTGDVRLSRNWLVKGTYTYADSVVTDDPSPDFIGNWIPEVPRHAGSLSVRFVADRGTRTEIRARAVGKSYGDADNRALQPSYQVVDLFFSQPLRSGLDLYVIAENVFDESYYLALTPTALRSGLPRTITAGFRFDSVGWRSGK